jgi:hypothetical protein
VASALWTLQGLSEIINCMDADPSMADSNISVRLYTNVITPTVNTIPADLTEPTVDNYAPITFDSSDSGWNETTVGNEQFTQANFTFHPYDSGGGDTTVRGAFVQNDTDDHMLFLQNFPVPLVFSNTGVQDLVLPITISVRQKP